MNDNISKIFSERIVKEREKKATYSKYIFNSHLIMFLIIVGGAIMINYSKWLKEASSLELTSVLIAMLGVLTYLLAFMKVKTYIKEADSVFLLPLEKYYSKILNKTIIVETLKQIVIVVIFYLISKPILIQLNLDNIKITSIILIIMNFYVIVSLKYRLVIYQKISAQMLTLISLNYLVILFQAVVNNTYSKILLSIVLIVVLVCIRRFNKLSQNINWYGAAEYDKVREENFMKFVSMFVDVPIKSTTVARRKYFDILLPKLTEHNFNVKNSYKYYFYRVFLRQEDTVFLVIRLLLVASVFAYSINNAYASAFILVAYSYLVIIQLVPLYKKITNNIWSNILPVSNEIKINSFKTLLKFVMLWSTLILFIVIVAIHKFSSASAVIIACGFILALLIARIFISKIK